MKPGLLFASLFAVAAAGPVVAEDSALILGKSSYKANCALCHGPEGKGGGEVAELFRVPPSDLTKLAERAGGRFPFHEVYRILISGMEEAGHGDAEMPIWGDYFLADSLADRGVSQSDALEIAAGRALSLVLYLESIQETE
ncbi:c-type cytochrome [Marimonas lutisalis]|uniref:c-type cytochrome n=1 Tax=Marimonas lutisalis TaxID=2545756 RepID=UPI0010F9F2BB|nr:c-type cytochrome [Marimonas lutisalis]